MGSWAFLCSFWLLSYEKPCLAHSCHLICVYCMSKCSPPLPRWRNFQSSVRCHCLLFLEVSLLQTTPQNTSSRHVTNWAPDWPLECGWGEMGAELVCLALSWEPRPANWQWRSTALAAQSSNLVFFLFLDHAIVWADDGLAINSTL